MADRRTARLRARLPLPVVREALPVPPDDGVRFHEVQNRSPILQRSAQYDLEHAIAVMDLGAGYRPLQNDKLVTKGGILQHQALAISDQ